MTAVFSFKNTIYSSTWCLDNKCYDAVAVLSNNMQKHVANYTHQYKIIMLQQNIQFLLWICFLLNPVVCCTIFWPLICCNSLYTFFPNFRMVNTEKNYCGEPYKTVYPWKLPQRRNFQMSSTLYRYGICYLLGCAVFLDKLRVILLLSKFHSSHNIVQMCSECIS